jgi:hypothetical protein
MRVEEEESMGDNHSYGGLTFMHPKAFGSQLSQQKSALGGPYTYTTQSPWHTTPNQQYNMLGDLLHNGGYGRSAEWFNKVRNSLDGLINNAAIDADILGELAQQIGTVCERVGIDTAAVERLRTALRRARNHEEMTFYDKELLKQLRDTVDLYEAETVGYRITAVEDDENDPSKLTVSVEVKPYQPTLNIKVHFVVEPRQLDTVDGAGDVMPAAVANRVLERARQQLQRALGNTKTVVARDPGVSDFSEMQKILRNYMNQQKQQTWTTNKTKIKDNTSGATYEPIGRSILSKDMAALERIVED